MIDEIKALSVWHEPLLDKTEEELEEMLETLEQQLKAKQENIQTQLARKINVLDEKSQKDCGVFQELVHTKIYPYVAGHLVCNELQEYMDCCIKIELGEKTEDIIKLVATSEQQIKCRSYQEALITMKEVLAAVTEIKSLPGFQNCIREYVTALVESCKLLISQDVMASQQNFHTCVSLLQVDRELDEISGKGVNEEQFMAVAHSVWFKLDKWKTASPPNVKWLDTEACNTGAAIYRCWEAYVNLQQGAGTETAGAGAEMAGAEMAGAEKPGAGSETVGDGTEMAGAEKTGAGSETGEREVTREVGELLVVFGLKELFVRYFSYRDRSLEWTQRARQFVVGVMGMAAPAASGDWRQLVLRGVAAAWTDCVSQDELLAMARHDGELAAAGVRKQRGEVVPVGGQVVDVLATRAVALTQEVIDRVLVLLPDPVAREQYLDVVLKQGIVETTANELKTQWNAMTDAFEPVSLSTSIVLLNSIAYVYTAISDFKPIVTDNMLQPLHTVLQRVVYLFGTSVTDEIRPYDLNYVPDSVQNAIDKSFLPRVQNEVFLEGISLILQVIAKELMDMVTVDTAHSNLAAVQAYIHKSIPPTKRDIALQLTLQVRL
ncbi:hypothetical protein GNI_073970 [Gregarina niphandrodes]|uniref:Uncharacterized protein n=1 Tax=Gregarina niphandrodes TaxID=110365 RepID=A0A023B709_GRENI|nr:hypothetical protein GNI_073970 [Gregarina niphandrodes]EZG66916.1 hypothetical protein GNI_073970 [Gregarina niphandrodes]|eukprot:XP_011130422.1 hypothetical protein GNI_073970 [Gregarina niphandrodes]